MHGCGAARTRCSRGAPCQAGPPSGKHRLRRVSRAAASACGVALSLLFRIVFACLFGLVGLLAGREISLAIHWPESTSRLELNAFPILGLLVGIAVSPFIQRGFERLVSAIEDSIAQRNPAEALSGAIGLVVGLIIAFLVRDIFSSFALMPRFGPIISFVTNVLVTLFFAYF